MKFVIFHGSFGHPQEHWFPPLKDALENIGQEVLVPKFPCDSLAEITGNGPKVPPHTQSLNSWFKVFERDVLPKIKNGEKLCFIGHSLGPVVILHIVNKYKIKLDCAIFISPFLSRLGIWQADHVNSTFYKTDFDFEKLRKLIPTSYVLHSENDPYVPEKFSKQFAELMHSSTILVRKAGHMNVNKIVNLNEFPLVLELCKSRLDLTLYQQYLAHRRELFAMPYTKKDKAEEVFYISAEDYFDEGRFKFRNLQREGFCTLFITMDYANPRSIYMEEARNAARRVGNFTRVFVMNNLADLKKKFSTEQVRLDIDAGINVYLCMLSDIKNKVKEPDFGIWDGEYLCITHFDKNFNMKEERISGRKSEIEEAKVWQKEVMKRATRIHNADKDVAAFIRAHS